MADELLVRDFMTSQPTTLEADSPLLDAALLMRRSGFRHLPIVRGEKLVGIITERDIHRYAPSLLGNISQEEYNAIFENTPLERVMTKNPISVGPNTPVSKVVATLHDLKLGCMPVVEDGRLVGIITVTDLLKIMYRLLTGKDAPELA